MCRTIMITCAVLPVRGTRTAHSVLDANRRGEERKKKKKKAENESDRSASKAVTDWFCWTTNLCDGIIHEAQLPRGSWMRLIFIYELWIMHAIQMCGRIFILIKTEAYDNCQISTTTTTQIVVFRFDFFVFSFSLLGDLSTRDVIVKLWWHSCYT